MDQLKKENLKGKDLIRERPGFEIEKKEVEEKKEVKEKIKERIEKKEIKTIEEVKVAKEKPSTVQPLVTPSKKSRLQKEIENILEEDLDGIYRSLSPAQQKEFREKGEETAFKISILIQQTKIKIKQILKLIIEWLKIIPGINRFFLEQEAKIKTDKILQLEEQK